MFFQFFSWPTMFQPSVLKDVSAVGPEEVLGVGTLLPGLYSLGDGTWDVQAIVLRRKTWAVRSSALLHVSNTPRVRQQTRVVHATPATTAVAVL